MHSQVRIKHAVVDRFIRWWGLNIGYLLIHSKLFSCRWTFNDDHLMGGKWSGGHHYSTHPWLGTILWGCVLEISWIKKNWTTGSRLLRHWRRLDRRRVGFTDGHAPSPTASLIQCRTSGNWCLTAPIHKVEPRKIKFVFIRWIEFITCLLWCAGFNSKLSLIRPCSGKMNLSRQRNRIWLP